MFFSQEMLETLQFFYSKRGASNDTPGRLPRHNQTKRANTCTWGGQRLPEIQLRAF